MRITKKAFILAIALLVATAIAIAADTDWPTFQHDQRHTSISSDDSISVPMSLAWTYKTTGPIRVQPVVSDGVVYFGTCGQTFHAIDARTGEPKWMFFTDGEVMSTAAVADGSVYFGCDDGFVYALDAETGKLRWKSPVVNSPPPPVPLTRYLKAEQVLAPPWPQDSPIAMSGVAKPTGQVVRSPVLVAKGMVFIGTGLAGSWGHLHGFDAKTGRLCWSRPSSVQGTYRVFGGVQNGPVLYRGILFWPEYLIEALDPYSGRSVPGWPEPELYQVGGKTFSFSTQMAVGEDGLAVAFMYASHYPHSGHPAWWRAIDLYDNSVRFTRQMGGTRPQLEQAPIIYNGKVFTVEMEAKVAAHPAIRCSDIDTGEKVAGFNEPQSQALNGAMAMANGILFAVSQDGQIFALDARSKGPVLSKLWTYQLPARVRASAAIADGMYFIGAEDGRLYAFIAEDAQ